MRFPTVSPFFYMVRGELDRAQRLAEHLLRLSRERQDSAGLVLGNSCSGRTLMLAGTFALSRSHLNEVLALYDPISHRVFAQQIGIHPENDSAAVLAIVLFCLGYPDQAVVQSNTAIDEARRLAHPPSLASSLFLGARLFLRCRFGATGRRADRRGDRARIPAMAGIRNDLSWMG